MTAQPVEAWPVSAGPVWDRYTTALKHLRATEKACHGLRQREGILAMRPLREAQEEYDAARAELMATYPKRPR